MQARLPRGPKNWPLKVCPQCGTAFGPKPGYGAKDWQRVKHCSFKCMGLSRRVPLATRLQRNARRNPQNGCLEWTGWRDKKGYGRVGADEIGEALAHRAAYIVANGPLIPGLHVLHRCDNPPCIEPTHLYAGTNDDNTRDRWHAPTVPKSASDFSSAFSERYIAGQAPSWPWQHCPPTFCKRSAPI